MNGLTQHHCLIAVIASVLTARVGDELDTGMTGAAVVESSEDDAAGNSAAAPAPAAYLGSDIPASGAQSAGHCFEERNAS